MVSPPRPDLLGSCGLGRAQNEAANELRANEEARASSERDGEPAGNSLGGVPTAPRPCPRFGGSPRPPPRAGGRQRERNSPNLCLGNQIWPQEGSFLSSWIAKNPTKTSGGFTGVLGGGKKTVPGATGSSRSRTCPVPPPRDLSKTIIRPSPEHPNWGFSTQNPAANAKPSGYGSAELDGAPAPTPGCPNPPTSSLKSALLLPTSPSPPGGARPPPAGTRNPAPGRTLHRGTPPDFTPCTARRGGVENEPRAGQPGPGAGPTAPQKSPKIHSWPPRRCHHFGTTKL